MDINDVVERIEKKQETIAAFEAELVTVKEDVEKKKKLLAETLLRNKNKKRKAPALQLQKKSVSEGTAEIQGLESVLETLKGELSDLEIKKKATELHASQGEQFQKSIEAYGEASKLASNLSKTLQDDLGNFVEAIDSMISSTEQARGNFVSILRGLPEKFSLKAFQKGVLEAAEDRGKETADRQSEIENINAQILDLSEVPDPASETSIASFTESAKKLSQWKNFVLKGDVFENHSYVFRSPKPLVQVREPRVPMQGLEWAKHIIRNRDRCDRKDVLEAERLIRDATAKAKSARETPRMAKTTRVTEGAFH